MFSHGGVNNADPKACSPTKLTEKTKGAPCTNCYSHTRDVVLSLLDNDQVEYAQVAVHDAPTDRSPPPVSLATRSKARVTLL